MARIATRSKVSVEDYLAWERLQLDKHEFFDGEVYEMPGRSPRHNRLSASVCAALDNGVASGYTVFSSNQRLRSHANWYVYADATVVASMPEIAHGDVITNPMIVVEVLSQSTEQYDRGLKWDGYQSLPSLTDYVLVSQDRAHIEHFGRSATGGWTYTAVNAGQSLTLTNGVVLDVDKLFAGAFELKGDESQTA